ncbi:efflux RND transporter periplasmic adaptor subunit [Wukongibacter baidiensis]|uniref:efflux RND transporter periplasmic adaptor subunit n=1 Tax=Wukongibacter baidiensis TaxID=1723361 RepID=UPI003D7F7AF0
MKAKQIMFLFSILAIIIVSGCTHQEVAKPNYTDVTVHEATIKRIEDIRRFSGRVESKDKLDIYPKTPGKVVAVNYKLGSEVKKGDILFEIDEEDFKREIEVLEKQLIQSKVSLDQEYRIKKSTYEQSKIAYKTLEKEFKNYKVLHIEGGISNQDFQNIEDSYKNARISYEQAKRNFDIVSGNLEGEVSEGLASVNTLKSQIENMKKSISDLKIESPIDGIVSRVYVNEGERYNLEEAAFVISSNTSMEIEVSVPEHLVNRMKTGKKVNIYLDSIQETFIGVIDGVSPMVHSSSGTYPVKVTFQNNLEVKSGMFAKVYIPIKEKKGLIIPRKSIIKEDGRSYVYIVSPEMKAIKTFVDIGIDDGINIEILSGIKNGDLIVNRGMEYLENNDTVEIVTDWE